MAKCPAFMDRYRTQVSVDKYFYNPFTYYITFNFINQIIEEEIY